MQQRRQRRPRFCVSREVVGMGWGVGDADAAPEIWEVGVKRLPRSRTGSVKWGE